jgi:hypothetical protein
MRVAIRAFLGCVLLVSAPVAIARAALRSELTAEVEVAVHDTIATSGGHWGEAVSRTRRPGLE